MCDLSGRALLCQDTPHLPTVKRMPAIMHDDILPDMGRMTPRLFSEESRGCSRAPIAAGDRAAAMYSLIVTAKMNDIDPQAWLADVLARIAGHPASQLDELLPWNWRPHATAASRAA